MRKVFFDNLPKRTNGNILWYKCVGKEINFVYEEVKGKFSVLDYYNDDGKYIIKLKYKDEIIETYPSNLSNCSIGKIIKYEKKHSYLYKVGAKFIDNKRNITITGYKNKETIRQDRKREFRYGYTFNCGICGWKNGWISENELKNGGGCACCHSKVVVKGINDISTTAPWMIQYFQNEEDASFYTKCSSTKLIFKCPHCGRLSNRKRTICDIYTNHGFPCVCSDSLSMIVKYTRVLLDQFEEHNQIIKYKTEEKFDWCKYFNPFKNKNCTGVYDFVIEEKKLIIEADGGFHRTDNLMSGQTKEESEFIDNKKDELAIRNGYAIIRISDEYDIQTSIQNSQLVNFFDFSCIDWKKCEIGSASSYLLKACEIKNKNPELTTTEIGNIMNFGATTVRRWLNYGAKHGLCIYDAEYERKKSVFTEDHGVSSEKEIICINNGMTFSSGVELCNKAKEIFNQEFSRGNISTCCNRKIHDIGGYIFRFTRDLTEDEKHELNNNISKIRLQQVNNKILEEFDSFIVSNNINDEKLVQLYNERHNFLNAI